MRLKVADGVLVRLPDSDQTNGSSFAAAQGKNQAIHSLFGSRRNHTNLEENYHTIHSLFGSHTSRHDKENMLTQQMLLGLRTARRGKEITFTDCKQIQLPENIRTIGKSAFRNCEELEQIELSEGTEVIDEFAFHQCTALRRIELPKTVREIRSYAFGECTALTSVLLPEGLENIETLAFLGCSALERLTLPNSIRKLGKGAFRSCTALKSVTLPNMPNIGDRVLEQCTALEEIVVPAGVQSIVHTAFYGCTGLKRIRLPETVQDVGFVPSMNENEICLHLPRGEFYVPPKIYRLPLNVLNPILFEEEPLQTVMQRMGALLVQSDLAALWQEVLIWVMQRYAGPAELAEWILCESRDLLRRLVDRQDAVALNLLCRSYAIPDRLLTRAMNYAGKNDKMQAAAVLAAERQRRGCYDVESEDDMLL